MDTIGKYEVIKKLGDGATSEVFLCHDPFNNRDVAVKMGLPFRDAHEAVARAVWFAESEGRDLSALTTDELRRFSGRIGRDVHRALSLEGSVAARSHSGGTAPVQVRAAIRRARKMLRGR